MPLAMLTEEPIPHSQIYHIDYGRATANRLERAGIEPVAD